jgi:hypothetical protein
MTNRLDYETLAGNLDASATFKQLIEYLTLASEDMRKLRTIRKRANDDIGGEQWGASTRRFEKVVSVITGIAHSRIKAGLGYKPN